MCPLLLTGAGGLAGGGAGGNETYSGMTIRPGADNGVGHMLFSGTISAASYTAGWTLQSREPSGTWTTITSWTGTLHGNGTTIIVTLTGAVDNWQGSHEFRASFDGTGTLNVDTFSNDTTLTNNSTIDLLDTLKAEWTLDEASGTRADSVGANDLTDNNTVTSTTGVLGDAAVMDGPGNDESLTIADNADVSAGDVDITIAGWVNVKTDAGFAMIMGQWGNLTNQKSYAIYLDNASDFRFYVSSNGSATSDSINETTNINTAQWYHVLAYHDSVGNEIGLIVDNGTPNTKAYSGGLDDSTYAFSLGNNYSNKYDGWLDTPCLWKKILSADEITFLYNSGSGRLYPYLPT